MPPRVATNLPLPDGDALHHSAALTALIAQEIENGGGSISFARYMELALHAPGLGYYSAGARKLGPDGDFVTAPEISPLFGQCLARQCADLLEQIGGGDLLEFGAGSGRLAADLLGELAALERLPGRYLILDVSADLRERQRRTLARERPEFIDRVLWLDTLPERFTGVMIANEVADAMPVHRFRIEPAGARELWVGVSGDRFCWSDGPLPAQLTARVAALRAEHGLAAGYVSEINPTAEAWISALASVLERGAVMVIDYGFPAREYYHPQRDQGTLMCHYRHRAHDDPFLYPGLQDITAHVDFTALAEAAYAAGLRVAGYTSQGAFLLACGLAERVGGMPEALRERLALAAQIRKLTGPEEMGELFKVLALTRGVEGALRGFALRDDRHRL